jgi:uncharacterized GH25 family protein
MYRMTICTVFCVLAVSVACAEEEPFIWNGKVVDANGRPIAEATVCLGGNRKKMGETTTDAEGNFRLSTSKIPADSLLYAFKKGAGFDFVRINGDKTPDESCRLIFQGLNPVRIRFVDQDDKPLAGRGLDSWLITDTSKGNTFDTVEVFNTAEVYERRFVAKSDEQGYVQFDCLPAGFTIEFMQDWSDETGNISEKRFFNDPYWNPARNIVYDSENPTEEIVVQLAPAVRISGKVQFEDGRPAPNVRMLLFGRGFMPCDIGCNPGRTRADYERIGCSTDQDGRYTMTLYGDMLYIFGPDAKTIDGKQFGAAPKRDIVSKVGTELENVDFVMKPFTRVSGQVLKKDGKPLANAPLGFFRYGVRSDELPPEKRLENKSGIDGFIHHAFRNLFQPHHVIVTNDEGHFEITLPPGQHTAVWSSEYAANEGWWDLRTEENAVKPLFELTLDGEEKRDLGQITLGE